MPDNKKSEQPAQKPTPPPPPPPPTRNIRGYRIPLEQPKESIIKKALERQNDDNG